MRRLLPISVFVACVALCCVAQESPDWAKREFAAPPNQVFAAALLSIQVQKHEVKWKDDATRVVEFHVGTTAWSWGYNMRLIVTAIDDTHSKVIVGVSKSGGKALSWGSGRKEVNKILAGIDAELAAARANLK